MENMQICERCEGSGADPMQALFEDVVGLCIECRGDGVTVGSEIIEHEELLPLSA